MNVVLLFVFVICCWLILLRKNENEQKEKWWRMTTVYMLMLTLVFYFITTRIWAFYFHTVPQTFAKIIPTLIDIEYALGLNKLYARKTNFYYEAERQRYYGA